MVTLDPCDRLKTIYYQLVPTILLDAKKSSNKNARLTIGSILIGLEERSYILSAKCTEKIPNCTKECELCNEENIRDLFIFAWDTLENIWKAKKHCTQAELMIPI
jgi:hypothetical protein